MQTEEPQDVLEVVSIVALIAILPLLNALVQSPSYHRDLRCPNCSRAWTVVTSATLVRCRDCSRVYYYAGGRVREELPLPTAVARVHAPLLAGLCAVVVFVWFGVGWALAVALILLNASRRGFLQLRDGVVGESLENASGSTSIATTEKERREAS